MSGSAAGLGGQQLLMTQSPAVSQPALKEKSTDESCGSKPSGGSDVEGFAIKERGYVEKSPGELSSMVMVRGESAAAATTFTGCTCNPAPCTVIFTWETPRLTLRASFNNVSNSFFPQSQSGPESQTSR